MSVRLTERSLLGGAVVALLRLVLEHSRACVEIDSHAVLVLQNIGGLGRVLFHNRDSIHDYLHIVKNFLQKLCNAHQNKVSVRPIQTNELVFAFSELEYLTGVCVLGQTLPTESQGVIFFRH